MNAVLTLLFSLLLPFCLQAQTAAWAKKFGANSYDRGYAIAVDPAGNSYITGYFRNTVAFGNTTLVSAGGADTYVAKLDPNGEVQWAVRAGSNEGLDQGNGIAVDADGNAYVTGQFSATATFGDFTLTATGNVDAFMAKVDPSGTFVWVKSIGGNAGDTGFGVAADAAGNSYVVGGFSGTAVFGATTLVGSTTEVFITKLDTDGNFLWATKAGGAQVDEARSIALDAAGNCYVTGVVGSHGDPGALITFGTTTLALAGDEDLFIAKLDPEGAFLWAKLAGGPSDDLGSGVATDAAGNCYVVGYFSGTASFGTDELTSAGARDAFVAKLDPAGNWQWAVQAGGSEEDGATAITTDAAGRSFVSGTFGATAAFGDMELNAETAGALFVSELDADGVFLTALGVGGSLNEMRNGAIAMGPAGDVYLTGWFRGEVDLAGITLAAAGSNDDIFVLKLGEGMIGVHEVGRGLDVSAYPNPMQNMLRIRSEAPIKRVLLHNAVGALVRTTTHAETAVEDLPAGLYFLQVFTAQGQWTLRVVKE